MVKEKSIQQAKAEQPYPEDMLRVYKSNRSAIKRFLYKLLPSSAEIDDILQDTFLRVYEAEVNNEIKSPKAYMFRTAHNLALLHIKKHGRLAFGEFEAFTEAEDDSVCPADLTHWRRKYKIFLQAIDNLSPQCRNVFILRKLQDKSHKEIAIQLGISTKTVESHITRAIVECRSYMAKHGYMKEKQP